MHGAKGTVGNTIGTAMLVVGLTLGAVSFTHAGETSSEFIIVPAVSDTEAKQAYPGGWKAPKPYIRIVPQPR